MNGSEQSCCICGVTKSAKKSIYENVGDKYLPSVIEDISGVVITALKEPFVQICDECSDAILAAEVIIRKCRDSKRKLQRDIKKSADNEEVQRKYKENVEEIQEDVLGEAHFQEIKIPFVVNEFVDEEEGQIENVMINKMEESLETNAPKLRKSKIINRETSPRITRATRSTEGNRSSAKTIQLKKDKEQEQYQNVEIKSEKSDDDEEEQYLPIIINERDLHKALADNTPEEESESTRKYVRKVNVNKNYFFECDLCEFNTRFATYFRRHMQQQHDIVQPRIFKCHKCTRTFLEYRYLKKHIVKAHEQRLRHGKYPCDKCDQSFDKPNQIQYHKRKHRMEEERLQREMFGTEHFEKENVQNILDAVEVQLEEVIVKKQTPELTHKTEETLEKNESTIASTSAKTKNQKNQEMLESSNHDETAESSSEHSFDAVENNTVETVKEEKSVKHQVKTRRKSCKSPSSSSVHSNEEPARKYVRTVNVNKNYFFQCELCEYNSTFATYFRQHMQQQHEIANPRIFKCPQCGRTFLEYRYLTQHIEYVHEKQPRRKKFLCAECGKGFDKSNHLEYHQRRHLSKDQRPPAAVVRCELCDRDFSKHSISMHIKNVHSTARPHVCALCRAAFALATGLQAHMKGCHPTEWFACPCCEARFRVRTVYEAHIQRGTCQKLGFNCDYCAWGFKTADRLQKHKLLVHKELLQVQLNESEAQANVALNNDFTIENS